MAKSRYYVTNSHRLRKLGDVGLTCKEESLVDPLYKPKHLGELVKLMETDGYQPKRISSISLDNGLPGPIRCAADFAEQFRALDSAKSNLLDRVKKLEEAEKALSESSKQSNNEA